MNKILLIQKRDLRLMNFPLPSWSYAVPLFIPSKILPLDMLLFETVSNSMRSISNNVLYMLLKVSLIKQTQFTLKTWDTTSKTSMLKIRD